MKKAVLSFVLILLTAATGAFAQHGGDVLLTIEGSGADRRVVTNLTGPLIVRQRVFEAELGEDLPNFTNEPGFNTASPGPFSAGAAVGFNLLDALRKWDDVNGHFDTIADQTLTVAYAGGTGGNLRTTPATADTLVPGFALTANSSGVWHRHLEYTLDASADDGIYLLQLELFTSDAGINPSLPFYLVFDQNAEDQHEAAVAYVQSNLVPEPASVAMVLVGGSMVLRRRRSTR